MNQNKKIETIVYEDFGFPIKLINVPMKKIYGEWFLDINLSKLQKYLIQQLINKPILTGAEIRFIRKYFEMTTIEFGKLFGTTHAAVVKWENNETRMNPASEIYLRLFMLDQLHTKDKEFREFYHNFRIHDIILYRKKVTIKENPIEIDMNEEHSVSA